MTITAESLRTVAGFLIAPFVPGVVIAAAMLALSRNEDAQAVLLGNLVFGYPIAFLLGVPSHLLLRRNGWTAWWTYCLAGALLGAVVYAETPLLLETTMRLQGLDASGHVTFSRELLPVAVLCAGVAAVSFWLIVRPDRASVR